MKADPNEHHCLANNVKKNCQVTFDTETIINSKREKLLAIQVDLYLNFSGHITCKRANQKLNVGYAIIFSVTFNKRGLIMSSFITSF